MLGSPQDGDLVVRIARGEADALGLLYDRHVAHLLALGRRMLGALPEAEDVLQGTFEEVWCRAGDFDPARGSVRAWLVVRMRSRCLDRLRRRRPSARHDEIEIAHEATLDVDLDGERARNALRQLTSDQRCVLELIYFEDLSFSEVALRLDIPVGTAKSRARLGLARLRKAFMPAEEIE